ncbi:flagellar export chaperone FliS [Paenibacillus sp. CC-CFT747]|nr:flagellar export chaperone FliS [Paenibacillus sp. CC-CFT747]
MNQLQRNQYLNNSVQTASPQQLLILLYDGAIRFNRLGIEAIKQKNYADASTNLVKVQSIISELIATLDTKSNLAPQLTSLYEYFLFLLREANVKKDTTPAEEVLGYLIDLKDTWMQAAKGGLVQAGLQHG